MKKLFLLFGLCVTLLLLWSCKSDLPEVPKDAEVTFQLKAPLGVEGTITEATGELTSRSDGKVLPISFKEGKAVLHLVQGEPYAMKVMCRFECKGALAEIEYKEDFVVEAKDKSDRTCQLMWEMPTESFVISEIFFAGSRNSKGEQYDEDKYLKITNNSPVTRYLDGLALVKSLWQSDEKVEAKPDVRTTHFVTDLVMQFPGTGREYAVKPYESVILCHSAIDHTKENPNSIDLSNANFEWMSDKGYTDSETPDNPKVPNMKLVFISDPYGDGTENWTMSTNGQNTYAIVDLQGKAAQDLVKECTYTYKEVMIIEGMDPMELDGHPALKLPNEWVLDAVNLGMTNEKQWLPISEKLDAGYAKVADELNDDTRYGKKVVRKSLSEGSKVLKDSNNSTEDFVAKELK